MERVSFIQPVNRLRGQRFSGMAVYMYQVSQAGHGENRTEGKNAKLSPPHMNQDAGATLRLQPASSSRIAEESS
jgi:hypothetical protein